MILKAGACSGGGGSKRIISLFLAMMSFQFLLCSIPLSIWSAMQRAFEARVCTIPINVIVWNENYIHTDSFKII